MTWGMSRHAALRIQEMCIPPQVIREVLEHPERTYTQNGYKARHEPFADDDRVMYARGDVAVLVSTKDQVIVTVLWRNGDKAARNDLGKIWKEGGWIDY